MVAALALAACGGGAAAVDAGPALIDPATPAAPAAPAAESAAATAAQAAATVGPAFTSSIEDVTAQDLWASWRPGCPLGFEWMRRVTVTYRGFDGAAHQGTLITHLDFARPLIDVFSQLYAAGYPIERMEPVEAFGGSDDASMAANNTSAFNCRAVTGGSGWSEHSFGWAIDVNPVQNPYVRGSTVLPPAGRDHLSRTPAPGRILPGDAVVQAFASIGWYWGGAWTSPIDYQHFSRTNR
jgi:hypothetical protein